MAKQEFSLEQVLNITGGKLVSSGADTFTDISTDSRTVNKGEIFIPLSGENFNGHKFIKTALGLGADAILFQKNENVIAEPGKTFIEVENTLKAYQNMATFVRNKINPFVIGITGSSGKTSTKEIASAFLSQFLPTYKSEANFNNEIGVPQTLLQLEPAHKVAIIEMGMRGRGQIKELAEIARPNAGIITGVGSAHIEILGSRLEIARAKWELAEYLRINDGTLILPAYDQNLLNLAGDYPTDRIIWINLETDDISTFILEEDWIENDRQYFSFFDRSLQTIHSACLTVMGKHQISNALLVIALSKLLKIELPDFIDLSFENLSGRSEEIIIGSAKIINDAYNANPESMKASIETFISIPSDSPKILVLGEMRELGDHAMEEHLAIGKFCSGIEMEKLVVIGENALGIKFGYEDNTANPERLIFCNDNLEAAAFLKKYLDSDVLILLKASRGAKLEEVLANLK
jgi:UDP-N-acetylmuramoyl-tripeptide--D-alanyl-D-alanine ligase